MRRTLLGMIALCSIAFGGGRTAHAADGAYGWATSNGATYTAELVPLAEAAARGETGLSMAGYAVFSSGRVSGAGSADEALSMLPMLGPAPQAGYLVAVGTSFNGGSYSAGYVVAGRLAPETTAPVNTTPATAAPVVTTPAAVSTTTVGQQVQPVQSTEPQTTTTVEVAVSASAEPVQSEIPEPVASTEASVIDTTTSELEIGGTSNGAAVLAEAKVGRIMPVHSYAYFIFGMLVGHFGLRKLVRRRR